MTDTAVIDPSVSPELRTFADVERLLADTLPGYEQRPGQQKFAAAVEKSIATQIELRKASLTAEGKLSDEYLPTHLLAQAGCGVGKSLGYLIPAILSGAKAVVSVTTKALQDQLAYKDLPFLEAHLPPFSWCVLKGRSNYLCLNLAYAVEDADRVPHRAAIAEYARSHEDFDGLRESLPFAVEDAEWWLLHGDNDGCKDANCSDDDYQNEGWNCFCARARKEAAEAQIVIANHALLFIDLSIGSPILGPRDFVFLDEAHELEAIAADSMGFRLARSTYTSLGGDLRSFVNSYAEDGDPEEFDGLVADLTHAASSLYAEIERNKQVARGGTVRLKDAQILQYGDLFVEVTRALGNLQRAWRETSFDTGGQPGVTIRKSRLTSRLSNALARTQSLITAEQIDLVRWVETEKTRGNDTRIVLKAAPVSVAEYLHNRLWSKVPTVLVSATLQVNGKFDFIAKRLGITSGITLVVESPFDFARQGLLYIPSGLPVPKGADTASFEAGATEEIVDLVRASRGRALVLFTSVKHEQSTAAAIRRRNRFGDYRLMVQGEASNKLLSESFKDDTSSVLFGLKSFMTGVDFQGETLSLLVVSKMPFPVPSEPITEARMERIEAEGGSSFGDYMLPVMSLVIQQAFGRAIRHTTDYAVVVCLDPRLADTGYGKKIQKDLPDFPVTRAFSDVEEFYQQH